KVRDSMYVTECTNTPTYDFDARYKSALTGYEYHYFPSAYAGGVTSCDQTLPVYQTCIYLSASKGKSGEFIGEDYCFFYNCRKNDFAYTGNTECTNDKITIQEIYPDYNLGNFTFQKTLKISENCTMIENNQPTNHYYSKGVGIIRKEFLDSNQVWNLVNYHIEK
ncbi:MAG: hypothetical protein HYR91_11170, partial [Flavobacteriia bacterium]|nr:hypothetical protein [Flavobacteriia bacterium]